MPEPETDLESSGSDADLLGFDADGPVDILGDAEESTDGSSGETTEEELEEQPVEGEESEELAAEGEAEEGDVAADQDEVVSGGYTFLGREYETQQAAEHAIKSQMGSVGSLRAELDQAHQERDQVKALYDDAIQQAKTPKSEPAEAEGEKVPPTNGKTFKKVSEVLSPEGLAKIQEELGPEEAYRFMLQEFDKVHEHNLGVVNDERLSVIETERAEVKEFNAVVNLFQEFASRPETDKPDSPPKYPEMRNDEAFIGRVTDRFLKSPGLREEGEYGVYLAYLAEKDWQQHLTDDAEPEESEPKPSQIINGNLPTDEPREDRALTSGPGPSPVGGRLDTEEDRIRQQLADAAGGEDNTLLGYDF